MFLYIECNVSGQCFADFDFFSSHIVLTIFANFTLEIQRTNFALQIQILLILHYKFKFC
jgi:hypothetical protein